MSSPHQQLALHLSLRVITDIEMCRYDLEAAYKALLQDHGHGTRDSEYWQELLSSCGSDAAGCEALRTDVWQQVRIPHTTRNVFIHAPLGLKYSHVQIGTALSALASGAPDSSALSACQCLQAELAEEVQQLQVSAVPINCRTGVPSCSSGSSSGGVQSASAVVLQAVTDARRASAERSAQLVVAEAARQKRGIELGVMSEERACVRSAEAHLELITAQVAFLTPR